MIFHFRLICHGVTDFDVYLYLNYKNVFLHCFIRLLYSFSTEDYICFDLLLVKIKERLVLANDSLVPNKPKTLLALSSACK